MVAYANRAGEHSAGNRGAMPGKGEERSTARRKLPSRKGTGEASAAASIRAARRSRPAPVTAETGMISAPLRLVSFKQGSISPVTGGQAVFVREIAFVERDNAPLQPEQDR